MSYFKSYDRRHTINELTLVLDNYIHDDTGLTFSSPIKADGSISYWWKVCVLIYGFELYNARGINRKGLDAALSSGNFGKRKNARCYCNIFTALNQSGLLNYNTKTKLWTTGKKFEAYRLTLLEMQASK